MLYVGTFHCRLKYMKLLKTIIVAILTLESRLILAKYKPFIVAVTGSVGKTSTKDAIYSVLKSQGRYVRKAEKSMNSETGLPITILGVPNAWRNIYGWLQNIVQGARLILKKNEYPDCLVLELGADHPNDIKKIAKWLHPDIVVITQISALPVHVEFFKHPEEVFEEKASLATAVKNGGMLVLFADNEKVLALADRVKDKNVKVISFGTVEVAQVKGSEYKVKYEMRDTSYEVQNLENEKNSYLSTPSGFTFKLDMNDESAQVSTKGILGKSYMYPLLAAAAVARARNLSISTIVNGLNSYDTPKGRMNIVAGINDATLIDDTYNSSPDAVSSALQTLKDLECSGVKIAVLGDMMELGHYSAEEHRKLGREVGDILSVNGQLVTVGQRSRVMADEAIKAGMLAIQVHSFNTSLEAGEYLKLIVKRGDVILIKGSQSIRMERTVKMLMKNPEQAEKLLVRQEKEWLLKK